MAFATKQFNWLRRPTAWEHAQAWRERRAAMREDFESINAAVSERLFAAQTTLSTGMASLAVQASILRVTAAADAAKKKLNLVI
jgi:hypothetical protein